MTRERLINLLSKVDSTITEEYTDYDLIEYVTCLKRVASEEVDTERWWDIWEDVYEVEPGVFLKYAYARSTGDSTPCELGYEDNGLDDIWEVNQKVITSYAYV